MPELEINFDIDGLINRIRLILYYFSERNQIQKLEGKGNAPI